MSRSDMDYEDPEDEGTDNTNLVKDLRKQLKAKDAEITAQGERLTALETADRKRIVAEVLKSKGVNEKVSAFYPADAEATTEKIEAWIADNADVFGVPAPAGTDTVLDEATVSGLKAITGADTGAAPDPAAQGLLAQVNAATSREALEALIAG